MIALKSLLSSLSRPDVAEVVLRGGKRPVARVGSATEELDGQALTGDDLLQILFSAGGSRYVESLGDRPAQWRTRVEGVGAVVVSAAMIGDVIEARFALRDAPPQAASRQRAPSIPPVRGRAGEGHGSKSARPPPVSARGRSHEEAPRARAPKAIVDAPPSTRRGRSHRASEHPDPAPRAELHPRRGPLPSAAEIDLEIGATEIPSVPGQRVDAFDFAAPDTPRTMPEAGFSRPEDSELTPIPASRKSRPKVEVDIAPPPPRASLPTIPSSMDVVAAFELDEPELHAPPAPAPRAERPPVVVTEAPPAPAAPVAVTRALEEPFAPSQRRPLPAPDEPVPKRTSSGRTTRPFARDPHTLLWQRLLRAARDVRASDLHLVAGRPPLYRVAGQIVVQGDAMEPLQVEDMILSRLPSRVAPAFEAEGSCCFAIEDADLGRFRATVSRQRTGIKASLRIVGLEIPTLAGLGLPESIGAATRHRRGLIVIAGPAGHGKTATLAAIVGLLNRETTRHIVTIEDPIEHVHPRARALMSQREVGMHARSVDAALEAAGRQDADVIVVGELRDAATARAALAASELGHLVITTMCAQSATRTIDRLVDLFPPQERPQARASLAGSLELIVSQRLLPDAEGKRLVAAAEVLPAMGPLSTLIREEDRTYQIGRLEQQSKHLGVVRLDDALAELIRTGRTTAASALAVAEAPEEMEAIFGVKRANAPPRGTFPIRPGDPRPPVAGPPGASSPAPRASDSSPEAPPGTPGAPGAPGAKEKGFFDNIFRKKGG
jgi:twitching motility protein PilT